MNKLIMNVDEESWRKLRAYCALNGTKISDTLADIINMFMEKEYIGLMKTKKEVKKNESNQNEST